MVRSMAFSISRAASFQPMKSNIITPDRITEPGLITSLSAYFGAVPCVASKTAIAVADVSAGSDTEPAHLRRGRRQKCNRRSDSASRAHCTRPARMMICWKMESAMRSLIMIFYFH